MTALAAEVGPAWAWAIAGLIVAAGELAAPGIFLIWIGIACVATGIVVGLSAPALPVQALVFAGCAIVSVFLGRRMTRHPLPVLNQRVHSLVGREFILETPIKDGVGRLSQGDTSWRITGPDLAAGSHVQVVALDGVTLVVKALPSA